MGKAAWCEFATEAANGRCLRVRRATAVVETTASQWVSGSRLMPTVPSAMERYGEPPAVASLAITCLKASGVRHDVP